MPDETTSRASDELQAELASFLKQKKANARSIDKTYEKLWLEIERLFFAGGKKMRPKLALLAYKAYGGKNDKIVLPVALSLEFLHLFLLVHDDVIDRDYTRYGTKNISGAYLGHYSDSISSSKDLDHYAGSAAILAGDVLYAACYDLILASQLDPAKKLDIISIINSTIFEVGGGELLDTEAAFFRNAVSEPLKIATYKTAGYSFTCPLKIGASLAEANAEEIGKLELLGKNLGIAFQIKDDLLSIFGDKSKTGKSDTSDIREKKYTFLIEYFNDLANDASKRQLSSLFDKTELNDSNIQDIKLLLKQAGVIDRAEHEIQKLKLKCLDTISDIEIDDAHRQKFIEIVEKCTDREK